MKWDYHGFNVINGVRHRRLIVDWDGNGKWIGKSANGFDIYEGESNYYVTKDDYVVNGKKKGAVIFRVHYTDTPFATGLKSWVKLHATFEDAVIQCEEELRLAVEQEAIAHQKENLIRERQNEEVNRYFRDLQLKPKEKKYVGNKLKFDLSFWRRK